MRKLGVQMLVSVGVEERMGRLLQLLWYLYDVSLLAHWDKVSKVHTICPVCLLLSQHKQYIVAAHPKVPIGFA